MMFFIGQQLYVFGGSDPTIHSQRGRYLRNHTSSHATSNNPSLVTSAADSTNETGSENNPYKTCAVCEIYTLDMTLFNGVCIYIYIYIYPSMYLYMYYPLINPLSSYSLTYNHIFTYFNFFFDFMISRGISAHRHIYIYIYIGISRSRGELGVGVGRRLGDCHWHAWRRGVPLHSPSLSLSLSLYMWIYTIYTLCL